MKKLWLYYVHINRRLDGRIRYNWVGVTGWYTEKTGTIPFPFKMNGIWSWWLFFFRFWTKWNSMWFKIERKIVPKIISHSIWKEMEIWFSQCTRRNLFRIAQQSKLNLDRSYAFPFDLLSIANGIPFDVLNQ